MNLMPGEKILLESDTKELVLTTHRIRFETKKPGRAYLASIMLEELRSCEIRYASNPSLIILAVIFIIVWVASLISKYSTGVTIGFIGCLVFTIAYLWTRRQVISLSSSTATINLRISGMSFDKAKELIDNIEIAKNQRHLLLYKQ